MTLPSEIVSPSTAAASALSGTAFSTLADLETLPRDQVDWGAPASAIWPVRKNTDLLAALRETATSHAHTAREIAQKVLNRDALHWIESFEHDAAKPKLSDLLWVAWAQGDLNASEHVTAITAVGMHRKFNTDKQQTYQTQQDGISGWATSQGIARSHATQLAWATHPEEKSEIIEAVQTRLIGAGFTKVASALPAALRHARAQSQRPDMLDLKIHHLDMQRSENMHYWIGQLSHTKQFPAVGMDPQTNYPRYFPTVELQNIINTLIADHATPPRWVPHFGGLTFATLAQLHAQGLQPVQMLSTSVRRNPRKVHEHPPEEWSAALHDIAAHSAWFSSFSPCERDFACKQLVSAIETELCNHTERDSPTGFWLIEFQNAVADLAWYAGRYANSGTLPHRIADDLAKLAIAKMEAGTNVLSETANFAALRRISAHMATHLEPNLLGHHFKVIMEQLIQEKEEEGACDSLTGRYAPEGEMSASWCTIL